MDSNLLAGSQIHIPDELIKFLKQDTYSLLIKGHAGTGKTTLALSMLHKMKVYKNCLYISTRISPDQLFQYHPWLGELFTLPTKSIPEDQPEATIGQPTIIDARLDEPSSLFERITNELMDVEAPTIILDTWDAIAHFMDREALMNNARVLQTWRERAGAKLIFISESPEDTTFDFLADGAIELKLRYHNERRIREMFLSKLRGIRINKPSYLFSVNHGVFRSYERYNPSELLRHAHLLIPSKTGNNGLPDNYVSSGYHEFDELLEGGFPHGSAISIELEPNVSGKIALAFLSRVISNFVKKQDVLVLQTLENSGIDMMENYLKSKKNSSDLINLFRFSHHPNAQKINKKTSEQIEETIISLKKKFPQKHLFTMISSDITEEFKSKHELNSFVSFIKDNSTVSVFVSRRSENDNSYLHLHSDVHLRILVINGTILVQPETPWSHLYAMVLQHGKENQIELDPIV